MLVKTYGSALYGVDALTITCEVSAGGMVAQTAPGYSLIGLPDNAVREGYQRLETALKNSGYRIPRIKIIINMAPADIRKEGSHYDLTLAIGVLAATEQIPAAPVSDYIIMGELSLDGSLRPIKGVLPMAIKARQEKFKGIIIPKANAREAAIVNNLEVYGVETLDEVIRFFKGEQPLTPTLVDTRDEFATNVSRYEQDFSDVKGQQNIKRALEIAAAGGHNAILIGPPGSGKSMLAKRLPTILPPLSLGEALETTKIHSVAGVLNAHASLVYSRPFRSPHHTISDVALVGGGSNPQPGEISMAHNGVLFLDELPEFKRAVLEVLRQPIEDRKVTIARAKVSVEYPCNFMLIAAMNPCPCGYYNHPEKQCTCQPTAIKNYLSKISGPLLDRIDLHVEVTPVQQAELYSTQRSEASKPIAERVVRAREIQTQRFQQMKGVYANAHMSGRMVQEICLLAPVGQKLLEAAMKRLQLSARAYERILKVARTIADLGQSENIKEEHIAEAIHFRSLDRDNWGK